jgi:hypothetical protein
MGLLWHLVVLRALLAAFDPFFIALLALGVPWLVGVSVGQQPWEQLSVPWSLGTVPREGQ